MLAALRALVSDGRGASAIRGALLAILGVAAISFTLAFAALRGRVSRG